MKYLGAITLIFACAGSIAPAMIATIAKFAGAHDWGQIAAGWGMALGAASFFCLMGWVWRDSAGS